MLPIIMIGGIIALCIVCGKRRRRRTVSRRIVTARNIATVSIQASGPVSKQPDASKLEKERQRICKEYNRRCKCELEKRQAQEDIIHLTQRKRDLIAAYNQVSDAQTEKAIRKRIAYDNAIRNTDKQIEKAYMILHRTY